MMKSILLAIFALLLASGCMTRRRFITSQGVPVLSQATAGGYSGGFGGNIRPPYGASQVAPYDGGYGDGYGQIQPYFVSEYAGSTYDPRTAGNVIQAEMMREQARRTSFIRGAPSTLTPTGVSREDLGAVMNEVDTLRRDVDRR